MSASYLVPYIFVMAGVTYLIRMLPLAIFKKKLKNRFIKSFLYYVPYAVLGAMTFPAILYATDNIFSAAIGLIIAVILAYFEKSLIVTAACACGGVLITELLMRFL